MRKTDGEVWLTFHGYLPTLAGKRSYALSSDYVHLGVTTQAQLRMQAEIREAIQKQKFAAIVVDGHPSRRQAPRLIPVAALTPFSPTPFQSHTQKRWLRGAVFPFRERRVVLLFQRRSASWPEGYQ